VSVCIRSVHPQAECPGSGLSRCSEEGREALGPTPGHGRGPDTEDGTADEVSPPHIAGTDGSGGGGPGAHDAASVLARDDHIALTDVLSSSIEVNGAVQPAGIVAQCRLVSGTRTSDDTSTHPHPRSRPHLIGS